MSYLLECMTSENVLSTDGILPYHPKCQAVDKCRFFLVMVLQELFLVKQHKKCYISVL